MVNGVWWITPFRRTVAPAIHSVLNTHMHPALNESVFRIQTAVEAGPVQVLGYSVGSALLVIVAVIFAVLLHVMKTTHVPGAMIAVSFRLCPATLAIRPVANAPVAVSVNRVVKTTMSAFAPVFRMMIAGV